MKKKGLFVFFFSTNFKLQPLLQKKGLIIDRKYRWQAVDTN